MSDPTDLYYYQQSSEKHSNQKPGRISIASVLRETVRHSYIYSNNYTH